MESTGFTFDDASYEIVDFFGSERVEVNKGRNKVTVHFPRVTVTNEQDESTEVTNLFARIYIDENGCYRGTFDMMRTEYTEAQILSRYSHSHLKSLSWPIEFTQPCLGRGPLRTTLTQLSTDPSKELWQLFCLELTKFVETESLAGIPYMYIRNIGKSRTSDYRYTGVGNVSQENKNRILKEFVNFIIEKKAVDFGFHKGSYRIAMEKNELIVRISNIFIEWCNSLSESDYDELKDSINEFLIEGKYVNNVIYRLGEGTVSSNITDHEGEALLNFNGEVFRLSITNKGTDEEHRLIILRYFHLGEIINLLIDKVNFEYGITHGYYKGRRVLYI